MPNLLDGNNVGKLRIIPPLPNIYCCQTWDEKSYLLALLVEFKSNNSVPLFQQLNIPLSNPIYKFWIVVEVQPSFLSWQTKR